MKFLGQWELGISQGTLIACRRARERKESRVERGENRTLTYVPGEGQEEGPVVLYRMNVWLAPGNEFEGCVFYQDGRFSAVAFVNGVQVAGRDDLWHFQAAHSRLKREYDIVFKELRLWSRRQEFQIR